MSQSWYSKRYRTPDIEIQRINNILQKQALERAQQEKPTSIVQLIGVSEASHLGMYDKYKAKLWPVADMTNFGFPLEPDNKTLVCGADFNAGVIVDDVAFMGNKIHIVGSPTKDYGLSDGDNMHVPIDLNMNGTCDYVRIKDLKWNRIKEIMESPPPGVDGITLIFRISPLMLDADFDMFLLSKYDNNMCTYGLQIRIKPDGKILFHCRRNGTVRAVYANNPFTLIPPPAGNYYLLNFMPENYLVVYANQVVEADHVFFFTYRFSDNQMKIYRGNAVDITAGIPTDPMFVPFSMPDPPPIPPTPVVAEIPIITSFVSGEDSGHLRTAAYDNNLSTYWMHSNRAASLLLDLGVPQRITYVEIAWPFGNTTRYYYDVYTGNQVDISQMTRVTPYTRLSSGMTTAKERYTFPSEKYARYVMIAGQGQQGDPTPNPPVSQWLNLSTATTYASAYQDEPGNSNPPANVKDGNLGTRWAAEGKGSWINIDFGSEKILTRLGIAWYKAELRRYRFKVWAINDTQDWFQVYPADGNSDAQSDIRKSGEDEYDHVGFDFPVRAYAISVEVFGNTTNNWASIWEIKVRANEPGGVTVPQSKFGISEIDVYGYPVQTEQDPFIAVYNNPTSAANTDEFFVRLHAPVTTTETDEETETKVDYINVYDENTGFIGRDLGSAFDRKARGQQCTGSSDCPFFGEKLARVSCYVKRHGSPTGYLYARIRRRSDNKIMFEFGKKGMSDISKNDYEEMVYTNLNNNYKISEDDIVSFEWTGGDDNNYLELAADANGNKPDCFHVFLSSDGWHNNDDQDLWGKYYKAETTTTTTTHTTTTVTVGYYIVAQEIQDVTSSLYGQVLSKFVFYLRRKGTLTGNVNFMLLDAQNNEIGDLGSVAASSITTSTTALTAISIDYSTIANTQMLLGYKIAVEYTGGNPSNYIMVKLYNDNNSSSCIDIMNSNNDWEKVTGKDLAGIFYKGGKIRVVGGDTIPPTPAPSQNYSHDMFLFVAGEENLFLNRFTYPLNGYYKGKINKFRMYRRVLTSQQMTNWNTNKKSISNIPYGKVFSPLTYRDTSITTDQFVPVPDTFEPGISIGSSNFDKGLPVGSNFH